MYNNPYKIKIVQPRAGKCGAGCIMGIMNYFFDTEFSAINSDDITCMVRQKPFEYNVMFTEAEMINFLANMGLKIKLYSASTGYYEKFAKDGIDEGFEGIDGLDKDVAHKFVKKIIKHKNVEIIYDNNLVKNTFNIIKKNQSKNRLFILGGEYFTLRKFKNNGRFGGHFFLSDGVEGNDFIIQDPGPPALFNGKIDRKTVEKSMSYIYEGADKEVVPGLLIQVEYEGKVNYV